MRGKKGDFNIIVTLIILLVAGIVGLLMLYLSMHINSFWESSHLLDNTAVGQATVDKMQEFGPRYTDYMIFFLFIGCSIGSIVGAARTNFSPIFIFLFICLMFISILCAAGVVNLYQGFAQEAILADTASQLTLTNFIFSRYTPLIIAVLSGLTMIIMWSKSGSDILQ